MGAGISFMSADVATPPTSEWQALAPSLASDSATLMSRLLLLLIFITIAACGLHLHMRKRLSVSDDDVCKEESEVRKHTLRFLLKQNNFVIITKEKKISLKVLATVLRYCSNRKVDRRRRRSPLRSSNSRSRVSRPTFSAASFNCTEERELHETRSTEKTSRCSKRNTRSTQTDTNRVQEKIDPPAMR